MRAPNITSERVKDIRAGSLVVFDSGSRTAWGITLDPVEAWAGFIRVLALPTGSADFPVPEVVVVEEKTRVLSFGPAFRLEIVNDPAGIVSRPTKMKREPGCLSIERDVIRIHAVYRNGGFTDSQGVDMSTWTEVQSLPNANTTEVQGWRIRLPETADGELGAVIAEWPPA